MLDRDLKNLHGPTGVRKLRLDRLCVGIIFRGKPPQRGLRLRAVLHQAAAPEHDGALQIGRPRRLPLDALRAADGEADARIAPQGVGLMTGPRAVEVELPGDLVI